MNICQVKNVPQPPFSLSLTLSCTHTIRNHNCAPATPGDAVLSIASPLLDITPLGWPHRGQAMCATFPLLSFYLPFLSLHFSHAHEYLSSEECAMKDKPPGPITSAKYENLSSLTFSSSEWLDGFFLEVVLPS
jgi:hypothetical protein